MLVCLVPTESVGVSEGMSACACVPCANERCGVSEGMLARAFVCLVSTDNCQAQC